MQGIENAEAVARVEGVDIGFSWPQRPGHVVHVRGERPPRARRNPTPLPVIPTREHALRQPHKGCR